MDGSREEGTDAESRMDHARTEGCLGATNEFRERCFLAKLYFGDFRHLCTAPRRWNTGKRAGLGIMPWQRGNVFSLRGQAKLPMHFGGWVTLCFRFSRTISIASKIDGISLDGCQALTNLVV